MRKIYLASSSKARRELFLLFGLKFKVLSSRIKEKRKVDSLSYATLVKRNALTKAKDVAQRVKDGIIIGADTITVQDRRIYGKPKNLKSAKEMLRRLSRKPQWVYTGIAIVDKDRCKTLLACEKTRVYMDRLSDKEIDNYFAKVSPLDKAGSFDIQAKGAFFIRRIEGCFYNVVGLPLRTLYRMFKKLNIKVFTPHLVKSSHLWRGRGAGTGFIFLLFTLHFTLYTFLGGCATEYNIATQQEEAYYYSTDKEIQIGQTITKAVEKEYKIVDDPLIQKRLEDIGQKIAGICDRKELDYYFKVLDDSEVNAFALPGGFVYIHKGLMDKVANDDELAAVLAHEIAHVVARHSIKKLQALQAYSILRILVAAAPGTGEVGNAADIAFAQVLTGYAREDELLADQLGARYTKLAGYNPRAMIDFLEKLQEINRRKPPRPKSYLKTHPYVPDRIRVVKQALGERIDFTDYINIEETKGK